MKFKIGDYVQATKAIRDAESRIIMEKGEDAVVVYPHMGSGSTIIARKRNNPAIEFAVNPSEIELSREELV